MRFLGVTETCDLSALYLQLLADGHEVRITIMEPEASGTLSGLVEIVQDWRAELDWIRAAGNDGIIIFESVSEGFGSIQDALRDEGFFVIGGSAFGDRLENERAYAQDLLTDLGFPAGRFWTFSDIASADAFIHERPARYVLKFSGPDHASSDNYVGQMPDGSDVRAMLKARGADSSGSFILMNYIEGVEIGVGGYFNGQQFLRPACLDWEHKRFFAGNLGELTGEMGTVATFDRSEAFFGRTLSLLEPFLRAAGHVGYVNLNTIVNEDGIWPLEFTCRFGYPGYAVLTPLQQTSWADLLWRIANGQGQFSTCPGFSLGVVLTTPPFPYTRKQVNEPVGLPVMFSERCNIEDRRHMHYGEMGLKNGQLVTSGLYGWTMVVTGIGETIAAAREETYKRVERVVIPNVRYRLDIGIRLLESDYARLEAIGIF